jgi:hypothetical protein
MPEKKQDNALNFKSSEARPRFPEKVEYIIGPDEALKVMRQALAGIDNFRDDRLYIFKTIVGPLVPDSIRNKIENSFLNDLSVAYPSLINTIGTYFSVFVLFKMEQSDESVRENYRFIVLPFVELQFKKKIAQLEKNRPLGWKIVRKFYQRNLNDISPLVDNLINLVALAWTFCPAIGEPEQETGYFNRFVFTSNGGFIDLGHFFNCAIVAYLYGAEQAEQRAEATEIAQLKWREKKWLVKLRERNYLRLLTNIFWGYATSANTIEDRASDKLGIALGLDMRNDHDNQKLIEYFIDLYTQMVRKSFIFFKKQSKFQQLVETIVLFFKNMFYTLHKSSTVDIESYMKNFFDDYDAIDPNDQSVVLPGLFKNIIDFYTEKYFSDDWEAYTCPQWQVIIPQDLWEQVVRGREKFQQKLLPIKIQLKTGQRVDPYPEGTSNPV